MKNKRVQLPEGIIQIVTWTFDKDGLIKCKRVKYFDKKRRPCCPVDL